MTIKEISDIWGISVTNINVRVKKMFPDLVKKGKTTHLTEEQVSLLNNELRHSGKAINQFAKSNLNDNIQVTQHELPTTRADMLAIIAQANEYLTILLEDARRESTQLRIELDKSKEYATVKRMQSLNDCSFDWRALKDYSIENGYEIKKVFDQNYGEVNAYHKDVWLAVYGEQCDEVPWND